MASTPSAEGKAPPSYTPEGIKNELVTQRVMVWQAKQREVGDNERAMEMAAMSFYPKDGPGCLMARDNGDYLFVPYDDNREGLPAELLWRIQTLRRWQSNPANAQTLSQVVKLMEDEINEKCVFEFLHGGDASQLDYDEKIRMLAKHRLTQDGVDVSRNDPATPRFRIAITDICEYGDVRMRWHELNWNCTEWEINAELEGLSRPLYTLESVLPRQLKQLETIQQPAETANAAQVLAAQLKAWKPLQNEISWQYFLCDPNDSNVRMTDRAWKGVHQPHDLLAIKRSAWEQGKIPVFVRSWQLVHYFRCRYIISLQERQLQDSLAAGRAREARKPTGLSFIQPWKVMPFSRNSRA